MRGAWVTYDAVRRECEWAQRLSATSGDRVSGLGASDCECNTHLFRIKPDAISEAIRMTVSSDASIYWQASTDTQ